MNSPSVRITEEQLIEWRRDAEFNPVEQLASVIHAVSSPCVAAAALEERVRQKELLGNCATVDCDIHVMGLGESPQRHATKVGGLPYRAKGSPWPVAQDGTEYTFICQFNFRASADLISDLPGDILLVFAKEAIIVDGGTTDEVFFEWQDESIKILCGADDCRGMQLDNAWYGYPCRSFDFEDVGSVASLLRRRAGALHHPDNYLIDKEWDGPTSARFSGLKIGGLPSWYFGEMSQTVVWGNRFSPPSDYFRHIQFLCGLGLIFPVTNHQHPWLNRAEPISNNELLSDPIQYLNWFDGFQVYFFRDNENSLHWVLEYR